MNLTFQLYQAGFCHSKQSHALRGTNKKTIRFYATYAHIEHSTQGHILFDTGYSTRFYKASRCFPYSLYANATQVFIQEEETAQAQLAQKGIKAEEVRYIIISHFHADHIGGLKDFPNATFICSKEAFEDIKNRRGFAAIRKGFLPDLLPSDFEQRVQVIHFDSLEKTHKILGNIVDIFDDESILLCDLAGHAKGQIGALLPHQNTFLIADAAWLQENYQNMHLPHPIVQLFFDSWKKYKENLKKVHDFHLTYPHIQIIPCHCETTWKTFNHSKPKI